MSYRLYKPESSRIIHAESLRKGGGETYCGENVSEPSTHLDDDRVTCHMCRTMLGHIWRAILRHTTEEPWVLVFVNKGSRVYLSELELKKSDDGRQFVKGMCTPEDPEQQVFRFYHNLADVIDWLIDGNGWVLGHNPASLGPNP